MSLAPVTLRGMTWNHPRGIDPLLVCSTVWRQQTGVEVQWDARSLQNFESYPLRQLAEQYDLLVIDHPHVGQAAEEECLQPLDGDGRIDDVLALEKLSVGPSFASYHWADRLWALPIDAAAQVQAFRPDRMSAPAETWADVMTHARRGNVRCPLRPPHSLMTFFSLCGLLGKSCGTEGSEFVPMEAGQNAFDMMRELIAYLDPADLACDPIVIFEEMSGDDDTTACVPFVYGYVNYAKQGFRAAMIRFADIPVVAPRIGSRGSTLGGTGIAVSCRSRLVHQASDFAFWLAGGEVQAGPYVRGGGQPAHAAAWDDDAANAAASDFYRATRRTLENAWVRPRHRGYMRFQHDASRVLNAALQTCGPARDTVDQLNALFRTSLGR